MRFRSISRGDELAGLSCGRNASDSAASVLARGSRRASRTRLEVSSPREATPASGSAPAPTNTKDGPHAWRCSAARLAAALTLLGLPINCDRLTMRCQKRW